MEEKVVCFSYPFITNSKGNATIDLGEYTNIEGKPIDKELARLMVKKALSKGGRGTNITKVIVRDSREK